MVLPINGKASRNGSQPHVEPVVPQVEEAAPGYIED
jgi:hypothetical protein